MAPKTMLMFGGSGMAGGWIKRLTENFSDRVGSVSRMLKSAATERTVRTIPDLETWSITAWVRTASDSVQLILCVHRAGYEDGVGLGLQAAWESTKNRWSVYHLARQLEAITIAEDPSDAISGRWYHVAATADGDVLRLYVDGVIVAEQPGLGRSMKITGGKCVIGLASDDPGRQHLRFVGNILTVALFEGALSAAEISAQFRSYAGD